MIKGRFERDLPDLEERGRILILSISKIRNEFRPPPPNNALQTKTKGKWKKVEIRIQFRRYTKMASDD